MRSSLAVTTLLAVGIGAAVPATLPLLVGATPAGAAVGSAAAVSSVAVGPTILEGTVGTAKVVMLLQRTPDNVVRGSYFYRKVGRDIPLAGSAASFDERDPSPLINYDSRVTGRWTGTWAANRASFTGTWQAISTDDAGKSTPKGSKVAVTLKATAAVPANTTAKVTFNVQSVKGPDATATYKLPVVSGTTPDWVGTRITGDFSAAALADESLADTMAQYKENGAGLTNLTSKVDYQGNGVLILHADGETMGAYPDGYAINRVYELRTGTALSADAMWSPTGRGRLQQLLLTKLRASAAKAASDPDVKANDAVVKPGDIKVTDDELAHVSTDATGITFHHDFGFPHVIEALEPDGDVHLSWAELRPLVAPGAFGLMVAKRG